jgi:hypothetical protein
MKNILIFFFALTLALSGCAARETSRTPFAEHYESTLSLIDKETSTLTKQTEYVAPPFPDNLLETNVFLRSIKPKPNFITLYQLYILAYYKSDALRNYNSAQDSKGNKFDLIIMYRDVGNRTGAGTMEYYDEHVIAPEPAQWNTMMNMCLSISAERVCKSIERQD